jgi:hypothetical protein
MNTLDQQAYELSKRLDATVRFSPEYYAVVRELQAWTAQHGRPLYATYSED